MNCMVDSAILNTMKFIQLLKKNYCNYNISESDQVR